MYTQTKHTPKPVALPVTLCHSCRHCEQDWFDFCDQYQQEAVNRNGRHVVLQCTGYTPAYEGDHVLVHQG